MIGSMVRAAESALKLEAARLQILKELDEKNQMLISSAGRVMLVLIYLFQFLLAQCDSSSFTLSVNLLIFGIMNVYFLAFEQNRKERRESVLSLIKERWLIMERYKTN